MKITIDTKQDSADDIGLVIRLLSAVSKKSTGALNTDLFEQSSAGPVAAASPGIFNLFGSSENNLSSPSVDPAPKPGPEAKELPDIMTY